MEWEQMDAYHQRAKVFGGWLVKTFENVMHISDQVGKYDGYDWRVAMTFVPDVKHEWSLKNETT